jgi:hypothetical protein
MGAGSPDGVMTNGEKVTQLVGSGKIAGVDFTEEPSSEYIAQQICDALGVDPEAEWVNPTF